MGRRASIKQLPEQAELLRLFDYNQETGVLTWRKRIGASASDQGFNRKCGGKPAGTVNSKTGYLLIGIRHTEHQKTSTYYCAHRLIWKLMTGDDPVDQVDHRDGIRTNNVWLNLRSADNGKNIWNSKRRKDNASGVKGVCWDTGHKKWRAYISTGCKQIKLGRFAKLEDAAAAVALERARLHGEFARFG